MKVMFTPEFLTMMKMIAQYLIAFIAIVSTSALTVLRMEAVKKKKRRKEMKRKNMKRVI